jgi:hypothetical protein
MHSTIVSSVSMLSLQMRFFIIYFKGLSRDIILAFLDVPYMSFNQVLVGWVSLLTLVGYSFKWSD